MAEESGISKVLPWVLVGVGAYLVYEWYVSSTTATTTGTAATPGTTATMTAGSQPTSVSTAPSSTPAQPSSNIVSLANSMVQYLGQSTASADQWNYAFSHLMGIGIEVKYGLSFDGVYGPVVGGVRRTGNMTATAFLQLAAASIPGGLPGLSGLSSAIVRFPGTWGAGMLNTLTERHHPLPYALTYTLRGFRGLGAFTQATGFEKALWAGRPLWTNRLR